MRVHPIEAAIDIGSNSVRLLVDRGLPVQPKQVSTTQLAAHLAERGCLSEPAMSRTLAAVERFYHAARDEGAERIYIFATEAVRAAKNGRAFAQRITDALHAPVHIVSGREEAQLGFIGAAGEEPACVLDIGGASVELSAGCMPRLDYSKSLPLGTLRVKETAGDHRTELERFIDRHIGGFGGIQTDTLTGIGGTLTSLAAVHLRQTVYDPAQIHGTVLTVAAVEALVNELFACKDIPTAHPVISEKRAAVLPHGALLTLAILHHTHARTLLISERDNLEGYLLFRRKGM